MIEQDIVTFKTELVSFLPNFDFKTFNSLSYENMQKVLLLLKKYFNLLESKMKSIPFSAEEIKNLENPEICIPLEKVIEMSLNEELSSYSGKGYWHFIDTKTNIHYLGVEDFHPEDLNQFDGQKDKIIEFLKNELEAYDLKLLGIMWYK